MSDPAQRPLTVGAPTGPEAPYPLRMEGPVIHGFGRGSRELGIPTANLPVDEQRTPWIGGAKSGVYFGWAALRLPSSHPNTSTTESESDPNRPTTSAAAESAAASAESDPNPPTSWTVYPMVMSIGYNTFYHNPTRSAEVHLLHDFGFATFYGAHMRLLVVGFIREERDYPDVRALVDDIRMDCAVARRSLEREVWALSLRGGGGLDGSWLVREDEREGGDDVLLGELET